MVDSSGSIVAPRTAGIGRKLGVQGGQGEPPGGVETGLQELHRIKTPLFDFKRDFAALLAKIARIRALARAPHPVRIT